ncbi:MAG: hypothetical protein J5777_07250 [Clostridiales bacterium]|nr:hypothetical protein [Clostridiales bacterium]
MEQQVTFTERPRSATGAKVFLILEMIALIAVELLRFVAKLFQTDAASNIPSVMVIFWVVFFVYIAGYILLLIGTTSRNNIGVLIAGFAIFMLLEWENYIINSGSFSGFINKLTNISIISMIILYAYTFVWICMIVLTCIKQAPKALFLVPGLIGVIAGCLLLYSTFMNMSMWSSLSSYSEGKEIANVLFNRIASIVNILVVIFRPFWIFMTARWLTHPTVKVAVRPVVPRPQTAQVYVPVQVPVYQPVPQNQPVYQQPVYQPNQPGYQQVPQQGYPNYGQPQQFPPQQ